MTPTPLPTPVPLVAIQTLTFVSDNYLQVVGAVWGVLILWSFLMVAGDKVKNQTAFYTIALCAMPLVLVNMALWALTIYLFVVVYLIVTGLQSVAK